jgi:sugar/nucleoside kinase (ribokinase family)
VSTVGAGDSYSATFLVEYLKGNDILDCMKKASNVSAHVVSKRGAI